MVSMNTLTEFYFWFVSDYYYLLVFVPWFGNLCQHTHFRMASTTEWSHSNSTNDKSSDTDIDKNTENIQKGKTWKEITIRKLNDSLKI